jgi:hypothetical protein
MASTPSALAGLVHTLLVDLDPARATAVPHAQRAKDLTALQAAAAHLEAHWDAVLEAHRADPHLHQACVQLNHAIRNTAVPADEAHWLDVRDHLSPFYEAMVTALRRHGERVPTLHPTNVRRTLVHILSGLAVIAAFEWILTPVTAVWAAGVFCVVAWTLETSRRFSPAVNTVLMKLFKPIARDHERYRVNSSTWYGTALLLIAITAWWAGSLWKAPWRLLQRPWWAALATLPPWDTCP